MIRIYRYRIGGVGRIVIPMQKNAVILSVHMKDRELCLWATVDPRAGMVSRALLVASTGQDVDVAGTFYVGTAVDEGGPISLVWHVFDAGEVDG